MTCRVERINWEENESEGPRSLVYKLYGGNIASNIMGQCMHINSPFIQTYLFSELSNRGWGPKLYGILDEPFGRIEEFIDSHTLGHEEVFEDEILSADVAKAYARFHSLKLPIPRRKDVSCMSVMNQNYEEKRAQLEEWIKTFPETNKYFDALMNLDMLAERDWVMRNCANIPHRVVLCNMDPSYLNRLVRNVAPVDENVTRSVIIDLDLTTYSHRGFDLGGHFATRLLDWSNLENLESGFPMPNKQQQKHFLQCYLNECKELMDDFDANSLDSLEHVTMEVELYSAIYLFWLISFSLTLPTEYNEEEAVSGGYLIKAIDEYKRLKREFCEKYPHVAC